MLYGSSYNNITPSMFLQTHKKKKASSGHARSTRVEGAIKQYYKFNNLNQFLTNVYTNKTASDEVNQFLNRLHLNFRVSRYHSFKLRKEESIPRPDLHVTVKQPQLNVSIYNSFEKKSEEVISESPLAGFHRVMFYNKTTGTNHVKAKLTGKLKQSRKISPIVGNLKKECKETNMEIWKRPDLHLPSTKINVIHLPINLQQAEFNIPGLIDDDRVNGRTVLHEYTKRKVNIPILTPPSPISNLSLNNEKWPHTLSKGKLNVTTYRKLASEPMQWKSLLNVTSVSLPNHIIRLNNKLHIPVNITWNVTQWNKTKSIMFNSYIKYTKKFQQRNMLPWQRIVRLPRQGDMMKLKHVILTHDVVWRNAGASRGRAELVQANIRPIFVRPIKGKKNICKVVQSKHKLRADDAGLKTPKSVMAFSEIGKNDRKQLDTLSPSDSITKMMNAGDIGMRMQKLLAPVGKVGMGKQITVTPVRIMRNINYVGVHMQHLIKPHIDSNTFPLIQIKQIIKDHTTIKAPSTGHPIKQTIKDHMAIKAPSTGHPIKQTIKDHMAIKAPSTGHPIKQTIKDHMAIKAPSTGHPIKQTIKDHMAIKAPSTGHPIKQTIKDHMAIKAPSTGHPIKQTIKDHMAIKAPSTGHPIKQTIKDHMAIKAPSTGHPIKQTIKDHMAIKAPSTGHPIKQTIKDHMAIKAPSTGHPIKQTIKDHMAIKAPSTGHPIKQTIKDHMAIKAPSTGHPIKQTIKDHMAIKAPSTGHPIKQTIKDHMAIKAPSTGHPIKQTIKDHMAIKAPSTGHPIKQTIKDHMAIKAPSTGHPIKQTIKDHMAIKAPSTGHN